MLNYIGQLGHLVGIHLYPDRHQPYYVKGMAICAYSMATVAVLAYALRRILSIKNQRMEVEDPKMDGEDEGLVGQALVYQGRKHFTFIL